MERDGLKENHEEFSKYIQINIEIRKRFRGEKNHVFTKKVN